MGPGMFAGLKEAAIIAVIVVVVLAMGAGWFLGEGARWLFHHVQVVVQ
jgi:hypothetical protein